MRLPRKDLLKIQTCTRTYTDLTIFFNKDIFHIHIDTNNLNAEDVFSDVITHL